MKIKWEEEEEEKKNGKQYNVCLLLPHCHNTRLCNKLCNGEEDKKKKEQKKTTKKSQLPMEFRM